MNSKFNPGGEVNILIRASTWHYISLLHKRGIWSKYSLFHKYGIWSHISYMWNLFQWMSKKEKKWSSSFSNSRIPGFLTLENAQTMEPTTAWTAVFSHGTSTMYSLLQLSGGAVFPWGAPYGKTVVRARPIEHAQRTGPPRNAEKFPSLRKKTDGPSEFRTRGHSAPSPTLCLRAQLARLRMSQRQQIRILETTTME